MANKTKSRGKKLEAEIEKLCRIYNLNASIKLQPKISRNGRFISGEPFDFIILNKKRLFCFDVKESLTKKSYPISSIRNQIHQYNNLLNYKEQGANCFYLVKFNVSCIVRFDIDVVRKFLQNKMGRKSMTPIHGFVYNNLHDFFTEVIL